MLHIVLFHSHDILEKKGVQGKGRCAMKPQWGWFRGVVKEFCILVWWWVHDHIYGPKLT